jgi:hypothetical protein
MDGRENNTGGEAMVTGQKSDRKKSLKKVLVVWQKDVT